MTKSQRYWKGFKYMNQIIKYGIYDEFDQKGLLKCQWKWAKS